ncbi:MAG TPA: glutathione-independent formaldehyde dehydrogenase [Solirubrobacteraceae bacterium]|nr:glutathione-independent formaldehyde dehydrogenase [Solirubrobacteraceae bacterium]
MKALVYRGPREVEVAQVPDARIEAPTDVLVRITSTNICGSDLHIYEGRAPMDDGRAIGHENMGEVVEVGDAVVRVRVGDMVSVPFNIACGFCTNCERGLTAFCLTVNPGSAGGAYGYPMMGPYQGGQAEYLRVPFGDFNCLRLPDDAREKEADYAMLADIWPTGWHGTRLAGLRPGENVAVFGAGPVGLMAALSAQVQGAEEIFVVDRHKDRLALAEQIGATPIDDTNGPAADQILERTSGEGVARGVEAVGWQAHDPQGHEVPNSTINDLIKSVRATGGIGVLGVFVPEDPQSLDEDMQEGRLTIDWGTFFTKGLHLGCGQANVKAYNRELRDLIHAGKVRPGWIVSHHLPLDEAPEAYGHFDARDEGWTKVVLHP